MKDTGTEELVMDAVVTFQMSIVAVEVVLTVMQDTMAHRKDTGGARTVALPPISSKKRFAPLSHIYLRTNPINNQKSFSSGEILVDGIMGSKDIMFKKMGISVVVDEDVDAETVAVVVEAS